MIFYKEVYPDYELESLKAQEKKQKSGKSNQVASKTPKITTDKPEQKVVPKDLKGKLKPEKVPSLKKA